MRVKAIPAEAIEFIGDNPLLLVGVAGVAVVGYVYVNRSRVVADDVEPTSVSAPMYGSYGLAPLSTGGIVSYAGSGTGGVVESVTGATPAAPDKGGLVDGSVSARDLFDFEVLKNGQSFDLSKAQLAANMSIAAMNADIAWAGIQASNYQTSSALAQAFLMSGKSLSMGAVVAPDGSVTQFGFTAYTPDNSKKGRETTRYQQVLASSGLGSFLANANQQQQAQLAPAGRVIDNATFGTSGSVSATPYASGYAPAPLQSGGGSIVEAVGFRGRNNGEYSYNLQ